MTPKTEKTATGWWVEYDWDYAEGGIWQGPFSTEKAALDWYFRLIGVAS